MSKTLAAALVDFENIYYWLKRSPHQATDATQAIAAAHAKLAATLNDVLTSCNHLGTLVQDTKREALLLIADVPQ